MTDPASNDPGCIDRPGGHRLAYHATPGALPGVIFLGGFMSDMTGTKAMALEAHCRVRSQAFLRFDYLGHGQSSGAFADGTIGRWADDAIAALDQLTEGPQILVGSSMGGWIMLLAALARPQRAVGLIGIAAAPDFTEDIMRNRFDDGQRETLAADGKVLIPSDYGDGEPYIVSRALIEDGRDNLLLVGDIAIDCPVRLLQGMKDTDVPWRTALAVADKLTGDDVEITLVKHGDHRLSEPTDLARLGRTLDRLIDEVT
ncbi:MAG: alpha/beta hydrolase [Alphaproteobacteria bacterium]